MYDSEKAKPKTKKVVGIILGVATGAAVFIWLFGWFGPITVLTPFGLILSRPQLRGVSDNLILGNEHLRWSCPLFAHIGTPAWNADDMVYGLTALSDQAKDGQTVYYDVYTEEEKEADPQKNQVGLYCLHSDSAEKKPYVILFAGGGFSSVCTFCESLPAGTEFQKNGYTVFMGSYRLSGTFGQFQDPKIIAEDVSREISFINEHADELNVETEGYLIGGFSAGSCVAATWCDPRYGYEAYHMSKPAAYCSMYGIVEDYIDKTDVPAFIRFCKDDPYFQHDLPEKYKAALEQKGVPCDMKVVDCLHGFGLGTGTEAEGWVEEAISFWQNRL